MARQTQINAKSKEHELTVQDHESDSPLLPISQIERLHTIRPDKVDWIFEQTEAESIARRKQAARINTFIFVERLIGLLLGFTVAIAGMGGAIWLAYMEREIAASVIGGTTLVSLVSTFVVSSKRKNQA